MKKYYIANWKMNMLETNARDFVNKINSIETENYIAIAASFTLLGALRECRDKYKFKIGAQNVASSQSGAFTGEVSAAMLADTGVEVVIVGHSERRHIFNESNANVHEKILLALEHNLDVILCVGETQSQRDEGDTENVIRDQISSALSQVTLNRKDQLIIAYEPVWAIGSGKTPSKAQIVQVHQLIDKLLQEYGITPIILYGGSVNLKNYQELINIESVDGFLIGGASLDAISFMQIAGERSNSL